MSEIKLHEPQIYVSLLSPTALLDLEQEIRRVEAGGAHALHIDVMDGHYVRNLTYGFPLIEAVQLTGTKLKKDMHLMISNPEEWVDEYCHKGADYLSFHPSQCKHVDGTLGKIKGYGIKAGLVFNPHETADEGICTMIEAGLVDFVLFMTINPGFSGQKFKPYVLPHARRLKERFPYLPIQIDGGIHHINRPERKVLNGKEIEVPGADYSRSTAFNAGRFGIDMVVACTAIFDRNTEIRARYREANYNEPISGILKDAKEGLAGLEAELNAAREI